ncbi:MAG: hypothetical protein ACJAYU_004088, partial [Bradymonadia bacterium]
NETDANETDANETDANETDANETDANETDANETDANETDANETDANEAVVACALEAIVPVAACSVGAAPNTETFVDVDAAGVDEFEDDMNDGPPMDASGGSPAPDPPERGDDEGGADAPRVRSFFPETLLVEPSIITDENGAATIPLTIADSITTWRMSGTANSMAGELGSGTGGLIVFQDFFVDINFPVALTQNDVISVAIALFNYSKIHKAWT